MKKVELSNGEWKLMKKLWADSPMTITALTSALKEETGWSKHTVISMLSRLEAKGSIAHREGDRAKEYYPVLQETDAIQTETRHFLDKVFGGNLSVMVNTMLDSRALTSADIEELSSILDKAKEERK